MTDNAMLEALKEAHREVRECMEAMEALASSPGADKQTYTTARYRISRASMARRSSFNRVRATLDSATPMEVAAIENIARLDRELMASSAKHVRRWSVQAIADDWGGYCAASRSIRRQMADELEAEEAMLFPILKRRRFDAEKRWSAPCRPAPTTQPMSNRS